MIISFAIIYVIFHSFQSIVYTLHLHIFHVIFITILSISKYNNNNMYQDIL